MNNTNKKIFRKIIITSVNTIVTGTFFLRRNDDEEE